MTNNQVTPQADRNFDPIADHFAKKVYGGLKGQIRLAVLTHDLSEALQTLPQDRPLKILDVGAGLAQISLTLAHAHHVTVNDISVNMLTKAKQSATELGVLDKVRFLACPYQELFDKLQGEKFDLILCHALLEWLGSPSDILSLFNEFLAPQGKLSLCFYNPASLTYRNLIMGNFYQLDAPRPADQKSLTPNNPVSPADVEQWLSDHHYKIDLRSGIRTFWDYTPVKRGGLTNPEDVINMELKYARQMPFMLMGRYLHIIASRNSSPPCNFNK